MHARALCHEQVRLKGRRDMQRLIRGVDPLVFWGSTGVATAFVLWGVLGTDSLASVMGSVLDWVITNFGWAFVLIALGALVFCIFVAISPYGRIRLGPDDSRPEFRTVSWVAMMFAAGLGLGLMFYGVAEPISHSSAPPLGLAEPSTRRPPRSRWRRPTSTGASTAGRSTRSWAWRSPTSPSAGAGRTWSARRSRRCWATTPASGRSAG